MSRRLTHSTVVGSISDLPADAPDRGGDVGAAGELDDVSGRAGEDGCDQRLVVAGRREQQTLDGSTARAAVRDLLVPAADIHVVGDSASARDAARAIPELGST